MDGSQVLVRVGNEQYSLAIEHVRQVVELGELTPVPGAPDSVLGLGNLGGEVIPAFDLASILQVEHDGQRAGVGQRRLLVVEHHGQRIALAVDEVTAVGPLVGTTQPSESPRLLATVLREDALVGVLDVEGLFDSLAAERAR